MLNLAPENLSRDDDALLRQIAACEGRASPQMPPEPLYRGSPIPSCDSSQLIVTYWGQSVLVAAVPCCSIESLLYTFERTPCGPTVSFRPVTETLLDICSDPLSKTTYPSSLICRLDAQGQWRLMGDLAQRYLLSLLYPQAHLLCTRPIF